eukprot:m.68156 g.68156  ORF g.68156 m.68156 type:complete len:128 (+) comp18290_c0_seq1:2427-2810(+)
MDPDSEDSEDALTPEMKQLQVKFDLVSSQPPVHDFVNDGCGVWFDNCGIFGPVPPHLTMMITLKRYEEEWRLEEQPLPAVKAALLASGFMAVEDNNFVAPRPVEPVRALLLSWGLSEVASLDDIANI